MTELQAGARFSVPANPVFSIRIRGSNAEHLGIAAVSSDGTIHPFIKSTSVDWTLTSIEGFQNPVEIVAFIVDDRLGAFVTQSYPIEMVISGQTYSLPRPTQQLAAVILGELYIKAGIHRVRISNEGYAFGVVAYARAKNIAVDRIPFRSVPSSIARPDPDQIAPDLHGHSRAQAGQRLGSGSGVIIGPNLVITNAHVIEDGNHFQIGRADGFLKPVAVDPLHDLALLQGDIVGGPLPLRIGAPLWLGENVIAAGFPLMDVLGTDLKVTTGNVSGLTGGSGDVSRFQFTAPIGSGNSGGAIVDEFGNLIGITSASLAHGNFRERGATSENINFGIRASLVFEMIAAAGFPVPDLGQLDNNNRRDVVQRLRGSVISILVTG